MDRTVLERMLGEGLSLREIGRRVDRHESTVAHWIGRYGLEANGRELHAARGALPRADLEALVEQGMSISEIAATVNRGKATVRHWLRKHGLKTYGASGRRRAQESKRAQEAGLVEANMFCSKHGETMFVLDRRGYYRCRRCRSASVSRRRRRLKELLVAEAGGACVLCGYSRCMAALEFHHVGSKGKGVLPERGGSNAIPGSSSHRGGEVCPALRDLPRRGRGGRRHGAQFQPDSPRMTGADRTIPG